MCHASTTDILDNLDAFHAAYYGADTFGGPSFYFHLRALDSRNCCDAFAEASYAMLVSWGMHRMGPRGAKMKDFDPYRASLNRVWPKIQQAAQFSPSEMDETEWLNLKDIFLSIDVMASGKLLVGNSKVMAHALPHIVPPIDGSYTLKYLCGKKIFRTKGKAMGLPKGTRDYLLLSCRERRIFQTEV